MGKREYVKKRYLLWTLRDLLNIINGAKLDVVSNINTFSGTFGKDLIFSSLYNYIKSQKHLIYDRDIPKVHIYVRFVRIIAFFLQNESISQETSPCLPIPTI